MVCRSFYFKQLVWYLVTRFLVLTNSGIAIKFLAHWKDKILNELTPEIRVSSRILLKSPFLLPFKSGLGLMKS